jgi:DNA repair ATPase RecN
MNTINNVTQYINKLNKNNSHYNRDDTWRKLIKTYENKINELEQKVINYEKMERKMKSRQYFFEKYCYKAEQKIEKIAKISKRYEQEHEQKIQLHKDLIQCQEDINKQKQENEKYKKEILKLKQFNGDKSQTTSPKKLNTAHKTHALLYFRTPPPTALAIEFGASVAPFTNMTARTKSVIIIRSICTTASHKHL